MLRVPEHERPVRRQGHRADEDRQDRDPADVAPEEVEQAGPAGRRLARAACHSSGSGTSWRIQKTRSAGRTPTRNTRRGFWPASSEGRDRGQQDAEVDPRLQDRRDPGPPVLGPRLREQRRADGPFSPDAERGHEPEDEQVPPRLRERREPREERIRQDRQAERPAPPQAIADQPEEPAAERPAEQEGRLDERAVPPHPLVPRVVDEQQLRDERERDQRIQVHVQPVEQPAEPGRDARLPLLGREVAQAADLVIGRSLAGRRLDVNRCGHRRYHPFVACRRSRSHHHLRGVDRLVFPLVGRDLERLAGPTRSPAGRA